MKSISQLTQSLCTMSVVSTLLFCLLPDNNGLKKTFKAVTGIVCASIVFTSVLTLLKTEIKDNGSADLSTQVKGVEEFIIEHNTEAFLEDVTKMTKPIFKDYGINCYKITTDNDTSSLVFYVDKATKDIENELKILTKVDCGLMVGEQDE